MKILRNLLSTSLLLSLSTGAVSDDELKRPLLNSERILQSFGSYGVHIVAQSRSLRATCLYSGSDAQRTCRTLALVRFVDDPDARLVAGLDRVRQGASLGETLVAAGWQVTKAKHVIDRLASDDRGYVEAARFLRLADAPPLALHRYELFAQRDGVQIPVAGLLEIHHPDYLAEIDLRKLYPSAGTSVPVSLGGWLEDLRDAFSGDAPFN